MSQLVVVIHNVGNSTGLDCFKIPLAEGEVRLWQTKVGGSGIMVNSGFSAGGHDDGSYYSLVAYCLLFIDVEVSYFNIYGFTSLIKY